MLDPNALTVLCKKKQSKLKKFRIRSFMCRRAVHRKRSIYIVLKYWGVKKPKKGMMVAFPSYHEFAHQVHPVKTGFRDCLVSWIETKKRIY